MLKKNKYAQALGKLGGLARAKALTEAQRLAISRKANQVKSRKRLTVPLATTEEQARD